MTAILRWKIQPKKRRRSFGSQTPISSGPSFSSPSFSSSNELPTWGGGASWGAPPPPAAPTAPPQTQPPPPTTTTQQKYVWQPVITTPLPQVANFGGSSNSNFGANSNFGGSDGASLNFASMSAQQRLQLEFKICRRPQFWRKFGFLTKIWIFDENVDFWRKFGLLTKIAFFEKFGFFIKFGFSIFFKKCLSQFYLTFVINFDFLIILFLEKNLFWPILAKIF